MRADSLSAGLAVLGTDTRYLFADPAYCRISGEAWAGLEGRPIGPRAELSVGPAALLAAVLADGHPRTHVTPVSRCTWYRLVTHGEVAGLAGLLTETVSTADRIGTTLDEQTTCQEAVNYLHASVADAVAIDLLPEPTHRAAVAGRGDLLPAHPFRTALSGRPFLDDRTLAVPLMVHGRVLGAVHLVRSHGGFSERDLLITRAAVYRAAVGIDHARILAEAQRTGVELQRALLTDPGLPHPNLELATRYLPSGSSTLVGGDWFETVRLHFGRTLLVMGDVMGHGVEAAVDMNSYRSTLRSVAAADLPPHRVLSQLDLNIAEAIARRPATCLLVRVDPARGLCSFSSAGHLPPALFSREGSAELIDVPVGPPLGTGLGGYGIASRSLGPGDTLLLFTDGLIERRGEDIDSSLARLARVRPDLSGTADDLVDEVLAALDASHAEDDVAVMAARIRRRPPPDGG